MKQYIVRNKKTGGEMLFKFDLQGRLIAFDLLETEPTQKVYTFIQTQLPVTIGQLTQMVKKWPDSELHELAPDLSFESFWNKYANKNGKKKMTENTWAKMDDTERGLALAGIDKYNKALRRDGVSKAYPSTYLNQRYWENYL